MLLHPNPSVTSQPVCLSSFHGHRQPAPYAPVQQLLHAQKRQTPQLRCERNRRCCTHAAQSMVDALGGKGQSAPQRAWWNDQQELWAAVHSPDELDRELQGNGKDLVVVGTTRDCTEFAAKKLLLPQFHLRSACRFLWHMVCWLLKGVPRGLSSSRRSHATSTMPFCKGAIEFFAIQHVTALAIVQHDMQYRLC